MSLFSDRRPMWKIGGVKAYMRQVAWSVWWRGAERRADKSRRRSRAGRGADSKPISERTESAA